MFEPNRITFCPDDPATDYALVFEARTLLDVLDFEFFRIAWRNWYGDEPDDRRLELAFVTFLFKQRAPDFVRHFARRVLRDHAQGQLDPGMLGAAGGSARPAPLPDLRDEFAAGSLAVVLGLLLVLAI